MKQNSSVSSMPRPASNSVSLPRFDNPQGVSDNPQTMGGLSSGNKCHTKVLKLSAGLRTHPAECSKLGKTRIIKDAGRGVVRNTGFCGQNAAAGYSWNFIHMHYPKKFSLVQPSDSLRLRIHAHLV